MTLHSIHQHVAKIYQHDIALTVIYDNIFLLLFYIKSFATGAQSAPTCLVNLMMAHAGMQQPQLRLILV